MNTLKIVGIMLALTALVQLAPRTVLAQTDVAIDDLALVNETVGEAANSDKDWNVHYRGYYHRYYGYYRPYYHSYYGYYRPYYHGHYRPYYHGYYRVYYWGGSNTENE